MQAKDVPEQPILDLINKRTHVGLRELEETFPQYPSKVLLAKLRAMVKKNLISTQCDCGCNGPYSVAGWPW